MINARLALVLVALAAPAAAHAESAPPPPAITVTGEGQVSVAPDIATVSSAVVTRAASAGAALKANAVAMGRVLAALKDAKVEDRDVATSGLTVQPQYDYGDGQQPRAPKLVGYEVRNAVTVRSRAVERLGELLDSLVAAGSNEIEGLTFDVSDRETRLDEARKAAMADARRKAELYAAGAGVALGRPLAIDEQEQSADPIRPYAMRAKTLEAAPATQIARGEQDLKVRLNVRWAIAP